MSDAGLVVAEDVVAGYLPGVNILDGCNLVAQAGDLIGIIGAWFSGCLLLGVNSGTYFYRVVASTQLDDIMGGFYKSIVFGLLVVTICCFQGYFTHMRTDSFNAYQPQFPLTTLVSLCTLFIGMVLYLILALSDPFQGGIIVDPTPVEYLIEALESGVR